MCAVHNDIACICNTCVHTCMSYRCTHTHVSAAAANLALVCASQTFCRPLVCCKEVVASLLLTTFRWSLIVLHRFSALHFILGFATPKS